MSCSPQALSNTLILLFSSHPLPIYSLSEYQRRTYWSSKGSLFMNVLITYTTSTRSTFFTSWYDTESYKMQIEQQDAMPVD